MSESDPTCDSEAAGVLCRGELDYYSPIDSNWCGSHAWTRPVESSRRLSRRYSRRRICPIAETTIAEPNRGVHSSKQSCDPGSLPAMAWLVVSGDHREAPAKRTYRFF